MVKNGHQKRIGPAQYFLGVDGGGSKTVVVMLEASTMRLKMARLGAGNIAVMKRGELQNYLVDLLEALLPRNTWPQITAATFAFAGVGRDPERNAVELAIAQLGLENFRVITDAELLYYNLLGEHDGIMIAAGTGSICLIRDDKGKMQRIGGLGYLLGDEGSGFAVGNAAIRHALHEAESGEDPGILAQYLLLHYGLKHPKELITMTYATDNPQRQVASCARLVCSMAESGEKAAAKIVEEATEALIELARQALAVSSGKSRHRLALAGSLLQPGGIINRMFRMRAAALNWPLEYFEATMIPAAGALLHAYTASGRVADTELIDGLEDIELRAENEKGEHDR